MNNLFAEARRILNDMHRKGKMPRRWRVITHKKPHFDEVAAIIALRRLAREIFPGIENADFVVEYTGQNGLIDSKTWQQHLREGTILVGRGGGPFDEHPTMEGGKRKKGSTACSLVIELRGAQAQDERVWKKLTEFVGEADLRGVPPLHASNVLKRALRMRTGPADQRRAIFEAQRAIKDFMNEQFMFQDALAGLDADSYDNAIVQESLNLLEGGRGGHPFDVVSVLMRALRMNNSDAARAEAINTARQAIEDYLIEQQMFRDARAKLESMSIEKIQVAGKTLKMAVVDSDNWMMASAARSLNIQVLVVRKSSGNVAVLTCSKLGPISLRKVAARLRMLEMAERGTEKPRLKAGMVNEYFEQIGQIREALNWWLQDTEDNGDNLLNGSDTADAEATIIPFEQILKAIRENLEFLPRAEKEVVTEAA
jgi:hypothetical protein